MSPEVDKILALDPFLVGRPSAVFHRVLNIRLRLYFLWTSETCVLCKAVQFSEGNAVTSAVMASTVDYVWNDRGRKNAVDRVQASSAASFARSCPCKKKRRWRSSMADWTFNRVRGHFLASKEFMLLLLFVEDFVVVTWWCCCSWMMRKRAWRWRRSGR